MGNFAAFRSQLEMLISRSSSIVSWIQGHYAGAGENSAVQHSTNVSVQWVLNGSVQFPATLESEGFDPRRLSGAILSEATDTAPFTGV